MSWGSTCRAAVDRKTSRQETGWEGVEEDLTEKKVGLCWADLAWSAVDSQKSVVVTPSKAAWGAACIHIFSPYGVART
jgi:hypothetical protein